MKSIVRFLFLYFLFFLGNKAFAQTMETDISDNIRKKSKQTGNSLVLQEGDSIKIYATYKNNKVTSMYATNKEGEKYILVYNPPQKIEAKKNGFDAEPIKCVVCITRTDGTIIRCWDIVCADIPVSKSTKTVAMKREN